MHYYKAITSKYSMENFARMAKNYRNSKNFPLKNFAACGIINISKTYRFIFVDTAYAFPFQTKTAKLTCLKFFYIYGYNICSMLTAVLISVFLPFYLQSMGHV